MPTSSHVFELILTYNEIIVTYAQYLGLIAGIQVKWPQAWKSAFDWVRLTIFRPFDIIGLPTLDYRSYYLTVVILFPLFFTLTVLVFFNPVYIMLFFFTVLMSIAILFIGILANFMPTVTPIDVVWGRHFITAGAIGLGLCLFALLGKLLYAKYQRSEYKEQVKFIDDGVENTLDPSKDSDVYDAAQAFHRIQEHVTISVSKRTCLTHTYKLFAVAVLIVMGLFVEGVFDPVLQQTSPQSGLLVSLRAALTPIFFLIAAFIFIYWIVTLTQKGRNGLEKAKLFFRSQYIRIILFSLTIVYIPTISAIFTSWNCASTSCTTGYYLLNRNSVLTADANTWTADLEVCTTCNFMNTCNISSELCPSATESRLQADDTLPCKDVTTYFAPVSAVMFLGIVVGVPWLYYKLIRTHTLFLKQVPAKGKTEEERWTFRTRTSNNSAKSLYMAFESKWRYYKVLLLVHKFLISIVSIFLGTLSFYNAVAVTVIHGVFFVVCVTTQPYESRLTDFLATATLLCLTISGILAALLGFGLYIPPIATYAVLIANFVLPILALGVAFVIEKRKKAQIQVLHEDDMFTPRTQGSLDKELNNYTLQLMSRFFMVLGLIAFVSLIVAISGIIYQAGNSNTIPPTRINTATREQFNYDQTKITDLEFANYDTWSDFTLNCCCMEGNSDSVSIAVELWKCKNGVLKVRTREEIRDGSIVSGLDLRPFCESDFINGYCNDVTYDTSSQMFKATTCGDVNVTVSDYALTYLW